MKDNILSTSGKAFQKFIGHLTDLAKKVFRDRFS